MKAGTLIYKINEICNQREMNTQMVSIRIDGKDVDYTLDYDSKIKTINIHSTKTEAEKEVNPQVKKFEKYNKNRKK